ncbi:DNA-3-methyladenine glycosylase [Meiothermus sp.]|uniref:DNA-3-methyladenine glycosylase family protein n=1 Tax=Meiothermus sp. TaxID=1955249 RepID=UPI0026042C2C|nr:DNA-3-methyladenine glycosylase 2 family protein [Meiothermus sp.]
MQKLAAKHGPAPFAPHPFPERSPYGVLLSSIVGQQLSGKAADTIWQRLSSRFALEPEVLWQARTEDLRAVGLSNAKARYVQDLSRFALEGGLLGIETQTDEEIIRHLTQVKGIGVWTVQMFLMFGLGRPDVWPVLDLGIRKGAQKLYGISERQALEELGERFRPYRSHAAWYLWRVLEP